MAKGKKSKDKDVDEEDVAVVRTRQRNAGSDSENPDAGDEGKNDATESKENSGILKHIKKKWLFIGVPVLILFTGGSIAFLNLMGGKKHTLPQVDLTGDNLKEESLSPFFIPPSKDLSRGAVRVDFTVIWDGLASVRYKSSELRVRAEAYDYLKGFTEKTADLSSQKAAMEEEMGAIFRKTLGVTNLAIRIKELKII
jgi:hypothetical protein